MATAFENLSPAQQSVNEKYDALSSVTDDRDRLIIQAYKDGKSASDIAAEVGLTRQHVHRIAARAEDMEYADDMGQVICPFCGTSYNALPGVPNYGHNCSVGNQQWDSEQDAEDANLSTVLADEINRD